MERLTKGTIEYLVVRVQDQLGNISTLAGTNPTYDLRIQDDDQWVLEDQPATPSVMRVLCLIDTNPLAIGTYELFVTFASIPQTPRLGPFAFDVS